MHHVVVEEWSRRESGLHRRDARVKLAALLLLLAAAGTLRPPAHPALAAAFLTACAGAVAARLPLLSFLARGAVVLPFSLTFAAVTWLAGDPARALSLIEKSYVSALLALLLIAVTPLPKLFAGLDALGMPAVLNLTVQFLYRYLFVIMEQAQHMRLASQCRGGGFLASAGALGVLFARSYGRAEGIHRSMLARGFSGSFPLLDPPAIRPADFVFLAAAAAVAALVRFAI